jgi:hypothetical protein
MVDGERLSDSAVSFLRLADAVMAEFKLAASH